MAWQWFRIRVGSFANRTSEQRTYVATDGSSGPDPWALSGSSDTAGADVKAIGSGVADANDLVGAVSHAVHGEYPFSTWAGAISVTPTGAPTPDVDGWTQAHGTADLAFAEIVLDGDEGTVYTIETLPPEVRPTFAAMVVGEFFQSGAFFEPYGDDKDGYAALEVISDFVTEGPLVYPSSKTQLDLAFPDELRDDVGPGDTVPTGDVLTTNYVLFDFAPDAPTMADLIAAIVRVTLQSTLHYDSGSNTWSHVDANLNGPVTIFGLYSTDVVETDPEKTAVIVSAGPYRTARGPLPSTVTLDGDIFDPDEKVVSTEWTQVSGPVEATIASTGSLSTDVTFSVYAIGVYVFALTATMTDGTQVASTVRVVVPAPRSPVVQNLRININPS